jgi:hypothetical protein
MLSVPQVQSFAALARRNYWAPISKGFQYFDARPAALSKRYDRDRRIRIESAHILYVEDRFNPPFFLG